MAKLTISRGGKSKPAVSLGGHIPSVEHVVTKVEQKIVEVVREIPAQIHERIVHVQVPVEKIVEVLVPQKVYIDREVEKIVEVEKRIEIPVTHIIEKLVEVPVEKIVHMDRIVHQEIIRLDKKSAFAAVLIGLVCGYLIGRL